MNFSFANCYRSSPLDAVARIGALLILSLFASCTQVKTPKTNTNVPLSPAPYFDSKTGIYFPGSFGSLFRQPIRHLENRTPGLGFAVTYRNRDARIDIFVYDLQASIIPIGIDATVIQKSFDDARNDLELAERKRIYSQLEIGPPTTKSLGNIDFLACDFTYQESLSPKTGTLLVSGINSQILKIRASESLGSDSDIERYLAFLGQSIAQSQRNGYGGISAQAYNLIVAKLGAIDLEDGLSHDEAISIAQIELVNQYQHNRYDVTSATVEQDDTSEENGTIISFSQYPTQPDRLMTTPLRIAVSKNGDAEMLPTPL